VRALVVDPNDPNRFYFGTLDGQIYTSTDAAQNWRLLVNFNRPRLYVDHIIVDPRDSKVIYVATHHHKDPGGFFKSTDGGLTWHEAQDLKGEAVHTLAQSRSNPDVLMAGTYNGIFRSNDAGESWAALPTSDAPGLVHLESLAIDPRNPDIIYAGTWYLPYKTTDSGQTWKTIRTGIIDDSDIFAINIDPRNRNHIIASACSGIYDSRNAGELWRKVQGIPSQSRRTRAILQHPSVPGLVFAGTTEGFWRSANGGENNTWMVTTSRQLEINSIAVHPRTPKDVYIGTNNYGVMVSHDAGKTFMPTNGGYSGRFANFILSDSEVPNRVYATTINTTTGGGFFFVSNDGGATWQPSMRSMPPRLISYSILQDEKDSNVIYLGTNLGIYRSQDRGATWASLSVPKPAPEVLRKTARRGPSHQRATHAASLARPEPGPSSTTDVSSDDTVKRAQAALSLAGYEVGPIDGQVGPRTGAAIRKFQNDRYLPLSGRLDQATLSALGVDNENSSSAGAAHVSLLTFAVNALAAFVEPEGGRSGILAATNAGLYRTFDLEQGWDKLFYGPNLDYQTTCVSTSARNPKTIWVGTATAGVLLSRDGGETWTEVPGIPASAPVNIIVQDKRRSAFIYVGTKQAFYFSHDGGEHWERPRGGSLPFGDFTSILVSPRNGDEILVGNAYQNGGMGGGVYRSTDAGATWSRIDPREQRLPSQGIWALAFDNREQGTLFVGSHSAGVYVVMRDGAAAVNGNP
jgi:photosystem II stability/assembly factor-like uncharacterized protein